MTSEEKKSRFTQRVSGVSALRNYELMARYDAGEVDAVVAELVRRMRMAGAKEQLRQASAELRSP